MLLQDSMLRNVATRSCYDVPIFLTQLSDSHLTVPATTAARATFLTSRQPQRKARLFPGHGGADLGLAANELLVGAQY